MTIHIECNDLTAMADNKRFDHEIELDTLKRENRILCAFLSLHRDEIDGRTVRHLIQRVGGER